MNVSFTPLSSVDWDRLDSFPDRTLFQTKPWLDFVAEAQNATPLILEIGIDNQPVGYFTGLIVKKAGFKIFGSPFPGWSTSYLGFNLIGGVDRTILLEPLIHYVFRELGCWHLELMDRHITPDQMYSASWSHRLFYNTEIDLSGQVDEVFGHMKGSCRTSIRKAERSGVTVEIAVDDQFASDYYAQLAEVFARQGLKPTHSIERVRLLMKHLLPTGNLLLLRARDAGGACIATGIYPAYRNTMYFWGGASFRKYQLLQPNELVHWFAMRYWKERGARACDMGGGGDYKLKYGGKPMTIPWGRKSRYWWVSGIRVAAQKGHALLRRLTGQL
jgi:hypothetical protein